MRGGALTGPCQKPFHSGNRCEQPWPRVYRTRLGPGRTRLRKHSVSAEMLGQGAFKLETKSSSANSARDRLGSKWNWMSRYSNQ